MTKKYKYLDELTDKTRAYKVKVKVIEKSRPKQSLGKPARQPLVLRDEKRTTMRGIIFGSDPPLFEQAVVRDGKYKIGDAIIAPVAEQYHQKENEFQMNFTRRMELIPVGGESSNLRPKYLQIQSIPRTGEAINELIDVIGIQLYVGNVRPVNISGREVPIRDIMIINDSTQYPLCLSAWNDLAETGCELYTTWITSYKISHFTDMRVKIFNGFTLVSTMSTEIILEPPNERTTKLQAEANATLMEDRRSMILTAKDPSQLRVISNLAEIKAKKAANTWQKYRIKVSVVDPIVDDMYLYMGCSKCGRKGSVEKGVVYYCKHCNNAEARSVPRVTFKITVSDGTGSHEFTIFTKEAETLIGFTSEQVHEYFSSGDHTELTEQLQKLAARNIYLQIRPTTTIASNRMLSWVIRYIAFE